LSGKKGHGFVVNNGKMVVCSDYRRHNRLKAGKKYYYGEEAQEEAEEVLTQAT